MSRLARKDRNDLKIKSAGGLTDLIDNMIKLAYRINDEEYNFIAGRLSEEEVERFTNDQPTFAEKRELLSLVNRYLDEYRAERIGS